MTRRRCAVLIACIALVAAGCEPKPPDYQSIWSTPATTTAATTAAKAADGPMPFSTYLTTIGVTGEPVEPGKLTDLTVSAPTPPGWGPYNNPKLAPGTRVIATRDGYPNATLVTFRLSGPFDVAEALTHADSEAEVSENFKKLNGSKDNFRGFPSSMIEGTYDQAGQRMQTYSRIVIATGTPPAQPPGAKGAQYLVTLTVTSFADEAAAQGPAIEAIIKGFTVAAKK